MPRTTTAAFRHVRACPSRGRCSAAGIGFNGTGRRPEAMDLLRPESRRFISRTRELPPTLLRARPVGCSRTSIESCFLLGALFVSKGAFFLNPGKEHPRAAGSVENPGRANAELIGLQGIARRFIDEKMSRACAPAAAATRSIVKRSAGTTPSTMYVEVSAHAVSERPKGSGDRLNISCPKQSGRPASQFRLASPRRAPFTSSMPMRQMRLACR